MDQPMLTERFREGGYSQNSWSMHEDRAKSEKLPFDFRKMFAGIALYIGSATVQRGYFCDVTMDPKVPRYFSGYPEMLKELICSLAGHSLSKMKKGGMVVKVDSMPVKNGGTHLVTVEISDTDHDCKERCAALETTLKRYSEARQYLPRNHSSWISMERHLKSPLKGKIIVHSISGWGSRYKVEVELKSLNRQPRTLFSERRKNDE